MITRSDLAAVFWWLGWKFQSKFRMDRMIDLAYPISMFFNCIGDFIEYGEARFYIEKRLK